MRRALVAALLTIAAAAQAADLPPPPGIVVEGAPPIPAALAEAIAPYTRFRPHALASWHPSRREMLVIAPVRGVDQLQRVREPGVAPQPLTEGDAPVVDAAYSPADADLAAFARRERDGVRLYALDLAEGKALALSGANQSVATWAWSAKGDRIAYAAREGHAARAATVVRLVDPRHPGSDRLLARLEGGVWSGLRFSDDGRRIALVEARSAFDSRLWLVDAASGRARRVTRVDPAHPAAYTHPRFSADGRALFASSDRGSEFRRLVRIPLEGGGAERAITAHIAHDVEDFDLSYDARKIAFVDDEDGADVLRFIDLATLKETPRPPLVSGVIGGLAWRPRSEEIGFHIASARSAGDVFSYDFAANRLTRWTNGNNPALNTSAFAEPAAMRWKSADGREIRALVYRPPARFTGKRPVIVRLHDGARSQARPGFLGGDNYLLNELGIAIVEPSLRGSPGSGKTFLRLGEGPRRVGPMQDLEGLLEAIAKDDALDASRVALAGDGEGAALALDFAARHPGRVAALVAAGGLAGVDAAAAKRIEGPLLLGAGPDATEAARGIAERLRAEGKPAWLLLAPDREGFAPAPRARFLEAAEAGFLRAILLR